MFTKKWIRVIWETITPNREDISTHNMNRLFGWMASKCPPRRKTTNVQTHNESTMRTNQSKQAKNILSLSFIRWVEHWLLCLGENRFVCVARCLSSFLPKLVFLFSFIAIRCCIELSFRFLEPIPECTNSIAVCGGIIVLSHTASPMQDDEEWKKGEIRWEQKKSHRMNSNTQRIRNGFFYTFRYNLIQKIW